MLLKPQCIECSSEVKDTTGVGVLCSRYKTGSLIRPDLTIKCLSVMFLILMARSQAPYIHVILADVVSIT